MAQKTATGTTGVTSIGVNVDRAYAYYQQDVTWLKWASADGVASRTVTQALAHNALVRKFTVRVGAERADGTTLDNSGQVRLQTEAGGSKIIVVDFGMLRTVSGVGRVAGLAAAGLRICSLRAFKGDGFGTTDLYLEDCDAPDIDAEAVRSAESNAFETRTDKVRLKIKTTATLPQIAAAVYLQFPDLPSDLDLRINGGSPAWSAPGVAQPNTHGWDATTHQLVDLTSALQALTGDSRDASALDAGISLGSRVPGLLTLELVTVDVAYLTRIAFGDTEDTTLVLDQEGEYDVVLPLPSWVATVQEVRFTLTATVPSERVLEPVGPPRALQSAGSGAAYDLVLDVDHAGSARLDVAAPFTELVGVRLPLRAGVDGAEVRVVLCQGNADGPTLPVAAGTSTPVDMPPAAAADDDVWTTFPMPKPVKLDHKLTYWAVVVIGRGGASWSLGSFSSPAAVVPIRRGAATGPWHPLPNVIVDGSNLGARIRVVGKAPPTAPVAPIMASIVGHADAQVAVTPTPKGVAATWLPSGAVVGAVHPAITPGGVAGAHTVTLRLTSRMTGTVKLSAVDIVATK
ncbi:MAG: hypothetical protein ABI625_04960 [bacterium]